MRLREALDLCTDSHVDEWVLLPGNRPATAMVAGLFDPGMKESQLRPLAGHSIGVYEPDARLSVVWPVPEDDEHGRPQRGDELPEWLEQAPHDWKSARSGWAVILLSGTPIWQSFIWYLDWGSSVGGYVPHFEPVFAEDPMSSEIERWEVSAWAVGLAGLINGLRPTDEFHRVNPTSSLVPNPSSLHPIDAARQF
jgi:hypothetical protein